MPEEAKFGFFRNAESGHRIKFSGIPRMLNNGQRLASEFFGQTFGTLAKGSAADLVILDYLPPTPFNNQNFFGHFLFGMNASMVQHVMVNGEWIVWNKQMMNMNEEALMNQARKVASKLWKKMS